MIFFFKKNYSIRHSILGESVDENGRPNYTLNANIAGWEDRGPITSVHCVPALKGTYTYVEFLII